MSESYSSLPFHFDGVAQASDGQDPAVAGEARFHGIPAFIREKNGTGSLIGAGHLSDNRNRLAVDEPRACQKLSPLGECKRECRRPLCLEISGKGTRGGAHRIPATADQKRLSSP